MAQPRMPEIPLYRVHTCELSVAVNRRQPKTWRDFERHETIEGNLVRDAVSYEFAYLYEKRVGHCS